MDSRWCPAWEEACAWWEGSLCFLGACSQRAWCHPQGGGGGGGRGRGMGCRRRRTRLSHGGVGLVMQPKGGPSQAHWQSTMWRWVCRPGQLRLEEMTAAGREQQDCLCHCLWARSCDPSSRAVRVRKIRESQVHAQASTHKYEQRNYQSKRCATTYKGAVVRTDGQCAGA